MTAIEPELIVVGEAERCDHVVRALNSLAMSFFAASDLQTAQGRVDRRTVGVVLVLPLSDRDVDPAQAIATMQDAGGDTSLPVFVVVPQGFPDEGARTLYAAGAAVVFEWPTEVLLLPRVVQEVLGVPAGTTQRDDADRALQRAVASRLHQADAIADTIDVTVDGGIANVVGTVDSLWQKQRVKNILGHVPGLGGVMMHDLDVQPPARSDEDLLAHVRDLVTVIPGVERETISVSVDNGRVDLAGTVASRSQLHRMVEVIGNVSGVREVNNHVVVAPQGAKRAANLARALQGAIAALHPDVAIEVAVFGSVAVLTGRVPLVAIKNEIEQLVLRRNEIDRVVNKIVVP